MPHASLSPRAAPPSSGLCRRALLGHGALLFLPLLLLCALPPLFMSNTLSAPWLQLPYWLSRSVDLPGLGLTLTGLLLISRRKLALSPPAMLALVAALLAVLGADFALKSGLKLLTQEPRPYLIWLHEQGLIPAMSHFYGAEQGTRAEQVFAASQWLALPDWLARHWRHEVNYAFPSGHTIAAMSLAQFFGLLWLARAPRLAWLLPLWALAVALSRLLLGMHWPRDLLASALLGGLTALPAACWWLRCHPLVARAAQ